RIVHDGGRCQASFLRHFEMLVEKIARGAIGSEPVSMQKEIMYFIGEYQLFEGDALFAEGLGQIDGFGERNVAVVVALDQENRRAPSAYGGKRRRFPRPSCKISPFARLVGRSKCGNLRVPVVYAVHVDSSCKEIGSACEAGGSEVTAHTAAHTS